MHILRDPDPEAALSFLHQALVARREGKGVIVQLVGGCRVSYTGRATSTLDEGERLILVKPDGTLLVHTDRSAKPVNWMPPGANTFEVREDDGAILLVASRRKPHPETVELRFASLHAAILFPLHDSEALVLKGTEGDLHKLFFENPALIEEGLVLHRGEKGTRRGPLDLWGTDRNGRRVIVEVKRSQAGIAEATQLWRYVEQHAAEGDGAAPPRGILVAPGFSATATKMLQDHGLEAKSIHWEELLPRVQAAPPAGQATLGRFEAADKAPVPARVPRKRTVRTGKKRTR